MRNENIKDELNKIPQEFDRDQLWAAIDLPKKKRKRRGAIWMFSVGVVLLGMLLFTFYNQSDNTQQSFTTVEKMNANEDENSTDKKEDQIESITGNIEGELDNESSFQIKKDKSTSTKSTTSSEINQKKSSVSFGQNQLKSKSQWNDNSEKSNVAESTSWIKLQTRPQDVFDTENSILDDSLMTINNSNQKNIDSSISSDFESEYELLKEIKPLPHLALELLEQSKFQIIKPIANTQPYSYHDEPFFLGVSMFSTYGNSIYDFGNSSNSENRKLVEKPLESVSFGIMSQLNFGKVELYSGFSFSRHNTHLNTTVEDQLIINSLQSQVQRKVTTQYSLFNTYQYIDLNIGVGYRFSFSRKWAVIPSVQLGYSLYLKSDGSILNENDLLLNLGESTSFSKWQGQTNLKIAKEINRNWEVGLLVFMTTRKSFGRIEDYTHSASSYGVGLSICRFIR